MISVVFPAPFGPMMPRTSPAWTSTETSSSAVSPPKRTVRSEISTAPPSRRSSSLPAFCPLLDATWWSSIAGMLSTSCADASGAQAPQQTATERGDRRHHALRQEEQDQDQNRALEDRQRDAGGRGDRRGDRQERAADDAAREAADAAQHRRCDDVDGECEPEGLRAHVSGDAGEADAGQRGEGAAHARRRAPSATRARSRPFARRRDATSRPRGASAGRSGAPGRRSRGRSRTG